MGNTVGKLANEHNSTKDTENFVPFVGTFLLDPSVVCVMFRHLTGTLIVTFFDNNKFIPCHFITFESTCSDTNILQEKKQIGKLIKVIRADFHQ